MNTRKTAMMVGILYIIGTVAGILSLVFLPSAAEASEILTQVAESSNRVITGSLFVLLMGLALAMVPIFMFPVLKQYNETLAVGYVVFRSGLEAMMDIALALGWLLLLTASREFPSGTDVYQSLGAMILSTHDWMNHILTIVFILGALMFYSVLYRSRLIPRWISGWGLIAAIPYILSAFLGIFDLIQLMSPIQMAMVLPLAVQEMVLAVWLIVKGFNPKAIAVKSQVA